MRVGGYLEDGDACDRDVVKRDGAVVGVGAAAAVGVDGAKFHVLSPPPEMLMPPVL